MAKSKKKSKKPAGKSPATKAASQLLDRFEKPAVIAGFFVLLFIFLIFFYSPLVFDGMDVAGGDVVSNLGLTHQWKLYQAETGERPLWNPYVFGGMPIYHRANAPHWSIDTLLTQLDFVVDWRIWTLWFGALGLFFLIRYLGLKSAAGMLAALGFVLFPHFHALVAVGHFSKLRALMWVPWILVTFRLMQDRGDLLRTLLFVLAFALQMRTQHYQIVFYTVLLLLFVGIKPYIDLLLADNKANFIKFNGLLVASIILVLVIVAQPFFVIKEYTPHSTRAGTAVNIDATQESRDDKGVGFQYATNWSYSPGDFWDLLIPKFHGGTSQEEYTGSAVPQLRNRVIPAYWGGLPFTQSYEYLGILLVFLALVGVFFRWEKTEVKALVFFTLFALLLSLGRNFAGLYKLFFYYFPYFDKFRVPMMILTLVMFNTTVLAAYGMDCVLTGLVGKPENQRRFLILAAGLSIVVLIPLLLGSSFALTRPQESQQFAAQVVDMLKTARLDILKSQATRTLLFLIAAIALVFITNRSWLNPGTAALGFVVLVALDMGVLSRQFMSQRYAAPERLEAQVYQKNSLDGIIEQDTSLYRVSPPLSKIIDDARWCYYHQSIAGYNPAKLQVFQDIVDNNLNRSTHAGLPMNLNVLSMLNVKYLVHNGEWQHASLNKMANDPATGLNLYQNLAALPRGYFVGETKVFEEGAERLKFMNSSLFAPDKMALLEAPLAEAIQRPDSSKVTVTSFTPNEVVFDVFTDKKSLLVVSEIYYPAGWSAFLESGEELPIHKTNHLLRSVVVPSGAHTVRFTFAPAAYQTGYLISLIGIILVYAGILYLSYREYGDRVRGWMGRSQSA